MLTIIWRFRARAGREAEFERAYGSSGDWVRLFRTAPGYLGSELWKDTAGSGAYLTIDRWNSEAAYHAFRQDAGEAYGQMDRRCADLTETEEEIGTILRE
jgi:heme-degrading monooxygenase HmoA